MSCPVPLVTVSAQLDAIATRHFGAEWPQHVAALTGLNLRTLQRVRNAGRNNADYPAAGGVYAALAEAVERLSADLHQIEL